MSEKNSASTNTLIVASAIGAIGVIFAACIGLVPTVLSMVRATGTPPLLVITATFPPTFTPAPETPSVTPAPTDFPTQTATVTEQATDTPTETFTSAPASSSELNDYVGTWTNVESKPKSSNVKLVVTRIEISKTSDTTADFSVCRVTQDGETYVQPNPAAASKSAFGWAAHDFVISSFNDLRWAVVVQRSGDQLVATVQEYDTNNLLLNSDSFTLKKASLLNPGVMIPCEEPTLTQ